MSRTIWLLLAVLLSAGCAHTPQLTLPTITPYKMDVQQGNVVSQEMISKLQPGMTRSQVRFVLGTPLVVDPFHADRWDYVFQYQKAGVLTEQRKVTVIFKDDKLVRIEGDVVPAAPRDAAPGATTKEKPVAAAAPAAASQDGKETKPATEEKPAGSKPAATKPAGGQPAEERGFFGRMLERLGF